MIIFDAVLKSIVMIKRILITFLMSFSLFGLSAQSKQAFKSISVDEFEKAISDTSYVVLDVRMPVEYAEGHIPGTDYNIDVLEDNFEAEALKLLSKDRPVALYCRSGNRSKQASQKLADMGYTNVVEFGGINSWPGETVSG